jgi:hypothetical protein
MRSLSPIYGVPYSLGTVLRARSDFPHSRYVLPNVELHQSEQKWEPQHAEVRTSHLRIFVGLRMQLQFVAESTADSGHYSFLIFTGILLQAPKRITRMSRVLVPTPKVTTPSI